jgi:hypothetical protein
MAIQSALLNSSWFLIITPALASFPESTADSQAAERFIKDQELLIFFIEPETTAGGLPLRS